MADNSSYLDIVVFAVIAAFLIARLWSVLGRRNGDERQRPNPFVAPPSPPAADSTPSNVTPFPGPRHTDASPAVPPVVVPDNGPLSLAAGLERVRGVDHSFNEKQFLQGAKAAFTMIVQSFAEGDLETLRPLLDDGVFASFESAIKTRLAVGQSLSTRIQALKDADVHAAKVNGTRMLITVQFVSEQINILRDSSGNIVEGDETRAEEIIDTWTFARDGQSTDPNWLLVETKA